MKIAVCDDEKIIRDKIRKLISNSGHNISESDTELFESGSELLDAVRHDDRRFDIIFLDIRMKGINGIQTARVLREQNDEVVLIFVTAIKEYVFEAFDVAAFHYLIKPIAKDKFSEVFGRAVWEAAKHMGNSDKRIVVREGKRSIVVTQDSILYVENKAKKLEIHTTSKVIEICAAMREIEKELDTGFYRCHRGYLVNMAYIAEYDKESITLKNGDVVFQAKDKYSEFVKAYMRYLRGGGCENV